MKKCLILLLIPFTLFAQRVDIKRSNKEIITLKVAGDYSTKKLELAVKANTNISSPILVLKKNSLNSGADSLLSASYSGGITTLTATLYPNDTKALSSGNYFFDVTAFTNANDRKTIWKPSVLNILADVNNPSSDYDTAIVSNYQLVNKTELTDSLDSFRRVQSYFDSNNFMRITSTGTPASGEPYYFISTINTINDNQYNLRSTYNVDLTANAPTKRIGGVLGETYIKSTNTKSLMDAVGTYGYVQNYGTGLITNAKGSYNVVAHRSADTISNAYGSYNEMILQNNGLIVNNYGLYVRNSQVESGTLQNDYGIYIGTRAGSLSNYSIYSATTAPGVFQGQIRLPDGSASAPAIAFNSALTTGLFWRSGDILGIAQNGEERLRIDGNFYFNGDLRPIANNSTDLGSASLKFRNIYSSQDIYGLRVTLTGDLQSYSAKFTNVPVYADNASALSGGLTAGQIYRTSTGQMMIVY